MKKDGNKNITNKFLVNGIKGFILAVIPIIIIEIEAMISISYNTFLINKLLLDTLKFGIGGIIISILYTYFYNFYPKLSKYVIWTIIIGYYIYAIIFFIIGIYFHMIGPLFGW